MSCNVACTVSVDTTLVDRKRKTKVSQLVTVRPGRTTEVKIDVKKR